MARRLTILWLLTALFTAPRLDAALADTGLASAALAGSTWTMVVSESCQLGQIKEIRLLADGTAAGAADLGDEGGGLFGKPSGADQITGSWNLKDGRLQVSLGRGSLTLDGPVTGHSFTAAVALKTDMAKSCVLRRK
jgi:hypothetical protein